MCSRLELISPGAEERTLTRPLLLRYDHDVTIRYGATTRHTKASNGTSTGLRKSQRGRAKTVSTPVLSARKTTRERVAQLRQLRPVSDAGWPRYQPLEDAPPL